MKKMGCNRTSAPYTHNKNGLAERKEEIGWHGKCNAYKYKAAKEFMRQGLTHCMSCT